MGTAIRKTAEKSSEKLFKLMKFCTVPNFHLTDLSLYHIILCPDLRRGCENALRHPGSCPGGLHAGHLHPHHGGDAAAGGGKDRRGHRQSAAAAGRRKRTTRAHDDRLPGKKAMEQTDGITGSSPPRLREIPGGAAFRCLWANMWSKGCGAERNA